MIWSLKMVEYYWIKTTIILNLNREDLAKKHQGYK